MLLEILTDAVSYSDRREGSRGGGTMSFPIIVVCSVILARISADPDVTVKEVYVEVRELEIIAIHITSIDDDLLVYLCM